MYKEQTPFMTRPLATMAIQWRENVDEALAEAASANKPLLLDFSAAPGWGGCVRLEAETYADDQAAQFIHGNFIPFTVNLSEHPQIFGRFHVVWTPTALIMSSKGEERSRIEGYLPREEFLAELKMGLGRVLVMAKRWQDAEKWFAQVADEHRTLATPPAMYWRAVCQYSATHDPSPLREVAVRLRDEFAGSAWTLRSSVWLPSQSEEMRRAGAWRTGFARLQQATTQARVAATMTRSVMPP
jgi:hypothetical protein